jgi:AAA+ superfamily predicted ATPase
VIDSAEPVDTAARPGVLGLLRRLDARLAEATGVAQVVYGPEATSNAYRGLYVNRSEVSDLLAREPGVPLFAADGAVTSEGPAGPADTIPELDWLAARFDLAPFDLDLILIALAPELDLRYERLYAFLQDDVTRRHPTVDLSLNLLCSSADAKLARRVHFAPEAPLIRHGLLRLIPDPQQTEPPLLAHYLKLDAQILDVLLGLGGLDRRLATFCTLDLPGTRLAPPSLPGATLRALQALVADVQAESQPLCLYFYGLPGIGKRQTATALAAGAGIPLLVAHLNRLPAVGPEGIDLLRVLVREAELQNAILYLTGVEALRAEDRAAEYDTLLVAVSTAPGITILAGDRPWSVDATTATEGSLDLITVPFALPDAAGRGACWHMGLAAVGCAAPAGSLDALSARFRLTPDQIRAAVTAAQNRVRWRAAAADPPADAPSAPMTLDDLFAAARAQCGQDLAALAQKIVPLYTWSDIVLPEDTLAQLQEICARVAFGPRVFEDWGFGRKLSAGKGTHALFAGPSGTGKTMAAEILANALGLDLYKIDLSGVVSKYIGETEKNLDRIFRAAEDANAILFFDEADALFGKRSEVRDSHDRYANIEISYLLQKMEQYAGIAILATNLRGNLDESFTRRLAFTVYFPFPDEAGRARIWAGVWPPETPLADDLDLDFLTHQFKLSGGNIKNIALAAAFLAAGEGCPVTMDHLRRATGREFQKMGKILSAAELAPPPAEVSR